MLSDSVLIRVPWNKYEAVLLVDAYLKCSNGEISKDKAVAILSRRFRNYMVRMGAPINETYRNESGISLQMSAIEYLFTNGASGISHVSNLFREIVDLYRSDIDAFNTILSSAIIKYHLDEDSFGMSYFSPTFSVDGNSASVVEDSGSSKYYSKKLYDILVKSFSNGYRIGSYMEVSRLRDFYKREYEEDLNLDNDDIDADIKACGIEYEGRVYLPENMLPVEVKEDLLQYISNFFSSGRGKCIFYSVLFEEFHQRFLDGKILSPSMLRRYLEFNNVGFWYFSSDYFSIHKGVKVDILSEVVDYVKAQGGVVSEDEVVQGLTFFPEKDVRSAFDNSKDVNLISCGRNVRFHIDNFVLSQEELSSIESIIRKAIKKYRYISFSELLKDVQTTVPTIASNNAVFGDLGLRNALAYKLAHKFSFTSNIISDYNNPIKAEDTFVELAKRERFTLDDISSLANDCGTIANAYIEVILQTAIRVEKELYVSKEQVSFDVEGIDSALMRFCTKDYIAFTEISTYSSFPDCNFQWNPFLLESYVAFYSKAFKLVHARYFGQKNVTGAIVKRGSSIKDFSTLASYAVADSDIPLNKKDVLEFLADNWYIAQRRTEEIDTILVKASQIRLNK